MSSARSIRELIRTAMGDETLVVEVRNLIEVWETEEQGGDYVSVGSCTPLDTDSSAPAISSFVEPSMIGAPIEAETQWGSAVKTTSNES